MVGSSNFPRIVPDDGPIQYHKWYWPWGCAIAINLVILWVFASLAEFRIAFGQPEPPGAVPVIILTESQLAPAPQESEPVPLESADAEAPIDDTPKPEQIDRVQPEAESPPVVRPLPDADIVVEPEFEPVPVINNLEDYERPPSAIEPPPEEGYANLTGPEIDELYRQRLQLPNIDLPEVGGNGSSGVIAIFCPDVFDDPDKIAECAGRPEIRSGWIRTDEDWTGITQALRRGGINVPGAETDLYGPAWRAPLAANEQYYEPVDQSVIIGPAAAKAIAAAKGYDRLKNASFGVGQTTNSVGQSLDNLGGEVECYHDACGAWEPSWVLRDDPDIDTATMERIIREGDSGE